MTSFVLVSVVVIGSFLLAMLIIDLYLWVLSSLLNYIRYRRANQRKEGYKKVRDCYYIQSLYQGINSCVVSGLNLFNSFWRWRKPLTKTPYKSDGECAKEYRSKTFESSFHVGTLSQAKKSSQPKKNDTNIVSSSPCFTSAEK
ncbi:hypothetical protein ACFLUY_01960 [Chloroflexota bacterium]